MNKIKNKKESKPTKTRFEIQEEMFLRKSENKAIKLLHERKAAKDKRTMPVYASKYGFKSTLIMYVDPALNESDIIKKFEIRLQCNHNAINDFRK